MRPGRAPAQELLSVTYSLACMEESRSRDVAVGAVSLIALILLIALFAFVKGWNPGADTVAVRLMFPSAAGLLPADPVYLNGVPVGSVAEIRVVGDSVLVVAECRAPLELRADAGAVLTMMELTGGRKIEMRRGAAAAAWDGSAVLYGQTAPDVGALFALVGQTVGDLQNIIRSVDTLTEQAKNLVADTALQGNVRLTVANAAALSGDLRAVVDANKARLNTVFDDIAVTTRRLRVAVDDNTPAVEMLVRRLDTLSAEAVVLVRKTNATVEGADTLIASANGIVRDLKSGKGLVGRLLYDEKFSTSIDSTAAALDRLVRNIQDHGVNVNLRLGTRP